MALVTLSITGNANFMGDSMSINTVASNVWGCKYLIQPYIAAAPATWTMAAAGATLTTGSTFTLAAIPASPTLGAWLTTSPQNFTIYWTDALGVQCCAYGVPLTNAGAPYLVWTGTAGSPLGFLTQGATITAFPATTSAATVISNLVICPEFVDYTVKIDGSTSATVGITGLILASQRTGLVVLQDATPHNLPKFVGPTAGFTWSGAAGDAANGLASMTSYLTTKAIVSTADTSLAVPSMVGAIAPGQA